MRRVNAYDPCELDPREQHSQPESHRRSGAFMVMAFFALMAVLAFVALSIDIGRIALTKTQMQNAVDSAALAAAMELTNAVYMAGEGQGNLAQMLAAAEAGARTTAVQTAALNDVFIDPSLDVFFGQRRLDGQGGFTITWGATPANLVKVQARMDNNDTSAVDGKLAMLFAGVNGGDTGSAMRTEAIAYVDARDVVVVLDYSSSMNNDTSFWAMSSSRLGQTAVENNLDDIWQALVNSGVTYSDTGNLKFPASGYGGINSPMGTYVGSGDKYDIYNTLGLNGIPWIQEGKSTSTGLLKGTKSSTSSKNEWLDYIEWVRSDSEPNYKGYRRDFGFRTLVVYLGDKEYQNYKSEDLWRVPYFQFDAMKDGVSSFCHFLGDLQFGDNIGLVVYWSGSLQEHDLNVGAVETGVPEVDLGSDWITDDYLAIDTIQRHKQAAHYGSGTGMGYGIEEARNLLNTHGRTGSRPTILLLTDGQTNKRPSGFNLSSWYPGWDWNEITDWDDDGIANYTTSNSNRQYSFYEAKLSIDAGYIIHTMSVGSSADDALMEAIAKSSGGIYYDVDATQTVAQLQADLEEVFTRIAANVPPAKLMTEQ